MKHFILLLFLSFSVYASAQCNELIKVSHEEYEKNFIEGKQPQSSADFVTKDGVTQIEGTDFIYNDSYEDGDVLVYKAMGKLNDMYVLKQEDELREYCYLLRDKPSLDVELCGEPVMYNNYILAIEGSHTDYALDVEVWKVKSNKVKLIKKISLTPCKIYVVDSAFISNGYIYLNYESEFYKVKI